MFIGYIVNTISQIQYQIRRWKNTHHEEEYTCCCTPHPRMFLTKEEKTDQLNKYKEWLENETKGVNEAIAKLKES